MTRNSKASLLIASMLVVTWATSSEACHRRRACQPTTCYSQSGYTYGSPQGYYGTRGAGMAGGGYYDGGYTGGTAGYPGGYGYGQPGSLRIRLRPAGLQPGRPRRAGLRAGGAARPGRRRLRTGALTDHRLCDHPSGTPRPGPTG